MLAVAVVVAVVVWEEEEVRCGEKRCASVGWKEAAEMVGSEREGWMWTIQ